MRICTKCLQVRENEYFYKSKNGYRAECKTCLNLRHKAYIQNKSFKRKKLTTEERKLSLETKRKYYQENKDRISIKNKENYKYNKAEILIRNKGWRVRNPSRHFERIKERINAGDLLLQLRINLRSRLSIAVKNDQKTGSAVKDLGCSIAKLKIHLQLKFHRNTRDSSKYMTWDNYGRFGWHIDHIRPLDSFDLSDEKQLKEACHYSNLQPLWWYDNLSKGAK